MFSPWMALSSELEEAMGPVFKIVIAAMISGNRKPRIDLLDGIDRTVSAIIANLMILDARPKGSHLVVAMEHRKLTRYDRKGFRKLPEIVSIMQGAGLVAVTEATFKKRRTTITATAALRRLLGGATLDDVVRVEGEETIRLMARPVDKRIAGIKQPKKPIYYEDTPETDAMRAEMEAINLFIANHKVELVGSPQGPIRLYRLFTLRRPHDAPVFNLHGRLYGGFWMTLKATERHRLRIDGEPIADLDFSSMFPRLAYAHLGIEAPDGDLYAIPGLEQHREGAKAAFSALLSYESEMKSLPNRVKEKLPEGWTAAKVKAAFASARPHLVPLFGCDFGLDLMFTESRILLATLRSLMAKGIPALPMHDGIMVPVSKSDEAKAAMEASSMEISGARLPVTLKPE